AGLRPDLDDLGDAGDDGCDRARLRAAGSHGARGGGAPPPDRTRTPNPGHAMTTSGAVEGAPRLLLRLEGAAVFALCLVLYARGSAGWPLLLVLFLAPDLSMLGYLLGARGGAAAYNAAHSYVAPAVLALLG